MIMDQLWLIALLLVGCAEAENQTEVKVALGRTVALNCSVNSTDIYWYVEIHSRFRGCIVRTFSRDSQNKYHIYTSTNKYEAIGGNRLVITNITAEDCRRYFCARRQKDQVVFEETFRITAHDSPDVPVTPSTNDSKANQQQQHIWRELQSELVIYSSFALNVLLLAVLTGLLCTSLCLKRKKCIYQQNDPSPFSCGNTETLETRQYEEIQFPTSGDPPPAPPSECIYYKAQLPTCTLPRH